MLSMLAQRALLTTRKTTRTELAFLLFLSINLSRDDDPCWLDAERAAWCMGVSERTVHYVIASLKRRGVLVVVRPGGGRGHVTHYRLNLRALPALTPWPGAALDAPRSPQRRLPFGRTPAVAALVRKLTVVPPRR